MNQSHLDEPGFYHMPLPTGKNAVGVTDINEEEENGSLFRIYYPSTSKGWSNWALGDEASSIAQFYMPWFLQYISTPIIHHCIKDIKVQADWNSQPNLTEKHSIVVVSHGYGSSRAFFSILGCELASQGYIVCVIGHRDGSALSSFRYKNDEKVSIPFKPYNKNNTQMEERSKEVLKVINALRNINDGTFKHNKNDEIANLLVYFKNKLDLSNIALVGHSFGCSNVLNVLSDKKKELRCGIILDPWMYPLKGKIEKFTAEIPLLVLTTEQFDIGVNHSALNNFLRNEYGNIPLPYEYFRIKGSHHLHGNDTLWLFGKIICWLFTKQGPSYADMFMKLQLTLINTHISESFGFQKRDNAKENLNLEYIKRM